MDSADAFSRYAVLVAIAVALWLLYRVFSNNLVKVRSSLDGKTYWVQNLADKQAAADMLATLVSNVDKLLQHIRSDANMARRPPFARLLEKYHPSSIQENVTESQFTSYTENKGERIVLCVRSKDPSQKLAEVNTVMFVFLHELAHIMTESVGAAGEHTPDFWDNFHDLLQEAVRVGIYTVVDYSASPQAYCGIHITDNPILDGGKPK